MHAISKINFYIFCKHIFYQCYSSVKSIHFLCSPYRTISGILATDWGLGSDISFYTYYYSVPNKLIPPRGRQKSRLGRRGRGRLIGFRLCATAAAVLLLFWLFICLFTSNPSIVIMFALELLLKQTASPSLPLSRHCDVTFCLWRQQRLADGCVWRPTDRHLSKARVCWVVSRWGLLGFDLNGTRTTVQVCKSILQDSLTHSVLKQVESPNCASRLEHITSLSDSFPQLAPDFTNVYTDLLQKDCSFIFPWN